MNSQLGKRSASQMSKTVKSSAGGEAGGGGGAHSETLTRPKRKVSSVIMQRAISDRTLLLAKYSQQQSVDRANKQQKTISASQQQQQTCTTSSSVLNTSGSNSICNRSNNNEPDTSLNNSSIHVTSETQEVNNTLKTKLPETIENKEKLFEYLRGVYDEVIERFNSGENLPYSSFLQTLSGAISDFVKKTNSKETESELLEQGLLTTNIELRKKYANETSNDKFRLEGQLQVFLHIEQYILLNTVTSSGSNNKTTLRLDEDGIWEIANWIRFLSQTFKERFKIEKFLFGEVYATYASSTSSLAITSSQELMSSLMEELGYDKEDKENDDLNASCNSKNASMLNSSNLEADNAADPNTSANTTSSALTTSIRVKNLFESDFEAKHGNTDDVESGCGETIGESQSKGGRLSSQSQRTSTANAQSGDLSDDSLLNEFSTTKKKSFSRTYSNSFSTNTMKSISLPSSQKTKLATRSSISTSNTKRITPNKKKSSSSGTPTGRKSPRIKDKQILLGEDSTRNTESNSPAKSSRRTCLVTDTPDHKQHSTLMTKKQEKIKKRIFDQTTINECFSGHSRSLPTIPDTPIKEDEPASTKDNHQPTTTSDHFPRPNLAKFQDRLKFIS